MKAFWSTLIGTFFFFAAGIAGAAVDHADKMAPEPTVGTGWIIAFLVVFVLFCVGVGIGIYRADKKSKEGSNKG